MKEIDCADRVQLVKIIEQGFAGRATSSTKMNDESSRSHCLVQVRLNQNKEGGNFQKSSMLNLVDLAGSEKVKKTGAKGAALKEAQAINTSLSALGKIIRMLSDGQMKETKKNEKGDGVDEKKTSGDGKKKKINRRKTAKPGKKETHIPYRDSKLTRLLQHSLGGNTKTMLLVACSPHDDNFEETMSTLRFAQRARMISNITSVNATSTSLDGFKATGTTAPELREQLSGLDNADTTMKDAVKECEASTFDPTGYKAKEKIAELRSMVEVAVGCAFEENLFNANGSKNGKESKGRPGTGTNSRRGGKGGRRGGKGRSGRGRGGKRR